MNSADPTSTDPTGQLSDFDRQKLASSTSLVSSATGTSSDTAALKMRAPSRCTGTPAAWAASDTARVSSGVKTPPLQRLWVFSRQTIAVLGKWGLPVGRMAPATSAGSMRPWSSLSTRRVCTPASAACPAPSFQNICAWLPIMISSPGLHQARVAIRLLIVPLAVSSPASWPSSAAARSCNSLMDGSSPNTSSPTSASAIARRIWSVGWVTVSLRKSITGAGIETSQKEWCGVPMAAGAGTLTAAQQAGSEAPVADGPDEPGG